MSTVLRRLAQVLAVAASLVPDLADACPACATREAGAVDTLVLVAALVAAPYVIAVVVVRIVRRLDREGP